MPTSQGFRSPAAKQISASNSPGLLGAPGGVINARIQPSKVRSHDAGFTATPIPGWTVSGTAHAIRNDHEIINTALDVYVAAGHTTRRQLEFVMCYQAHRDLGA
ncbi:MAG: hypothetical protein M3Y65_17665 [Pseudomonadota bacterium]|nr:hypothetical protein [Pseudomonadota bacterium]